MVHHPRAGQTSVTPAQAYRWARTLLPFPQEENMVRKENLNIHHTLLHLPDVCNPDNDASLTLSPLFALSHFTLTAALCICSSHFKLASHLFLAHSPYVLLFFIIHVHVDLMLYSCAELLNYIMYANSTGQEYMFTYFQATVIHKSRWHGIYLDGSRTVIV